MFTCLSQGPTDRLSIPLRHTSLVESVDDHPSGCAPSRVGPQHSLSVATESWRFVVAQAPASCDPIKIRVRSALPPQEIAPTRVNEGIEARTLARAERPLKF